MTPLTLCGIAALSLTSHSHGQPSGLADTLNDVPVVCASPAAVASSYNALVEEYNNYYGLPVASDPMLSGEILAYHVAQPTAAGHQQAWGRIIISDNLDFEYTQQVLAHEAAHVYDLQLGTGVQAISTSLQHGALRLPPSPAEGQPQQSQQVRYSEAFADMDAEVYARMVTYATGWWPSWESFPDDRSWFDSPQELRALRSSGFIPSW